MDSLPVIRPRQVINALLRNGFCLHHQTGSHARLVHKTRSDLKVAVPIHSKDIPKVTLKRIIRQANLTVDEFLKLLD